MEFNIFIKELREKAKLTQEVASKEIDVSISTIQNWERGTVKPDLNNLSSISKVYKTDVKTLLTQIAISLDNNETNNENTCEEFQYINLLPSDLDFSPIEKLKFTKEESDIFALLALNILFNGNPIQSLLTINNNPIEIANILDKFKGLDLYKTDFNIWESSYNSGKGNIKSYSSDLTEKGLLVFDIMKKNPDKLFSIYNISINEFLSFCDLYNIYEKPIYKNELIEKIVKEDLSLDFYEYKERYSKWEKSKTYYNHNTDTLENAITKISSEYYEIVEMELSDERYLIEHEMYLKKKSFYDEHKNVMDDLQPPKQIDKLYIRKIVPTQKAIDLVNCL